MVQTGRMLLTFIAEVAEEPLVLDPDDQLAESRNNTWSLGADVEERLALTVEQVAAAFEQTAEALRERWSDLAAVGIDGQNHPDAVSEPRPFPVWARRIGRDA